MSKKMKTSIFLVVMFSVIAIAFAVLHILGVVKNLDSYLVMTYMSYFLGLAMMYFTSYHKQKGNVKSMYACLVTCIVLLVISIASLIYGLCTGEITLFL